jgi:TPR repeat protein
MSRAYFIQRDPEQEAEATRLFGRACSLGLAIGCTNYGAGLWLNHQPASDADTACARRLFDRSCAAREQFGCGMAGRMMAADAKTPEQKQAARRWFDRTCTDLGAMSCRMYAHHLERGDLGDFDQATVHALMQRACDTGDEDACGHDNATETFR